MKPVQTWSWLEEHQRTSLNLLLSGLFFLLLFLTSGCSRQAQPIDSPSSEPYSNQTPIQTGNSSPIALKILVGADGIYRIKPGDLQAAGLAVERLDLRKASLTLLGQPVPVWLEQEKGIWDIYFYGRSTSSLYTADNVYWLQFGGELSDLMSTITLQSGAYPGNSQILQTYISTQRTEQQLIYYPQAKDGDHWFWDSISAPKSQDFEITLTQFAQGPQSPGRMIVSLYGTTEASQDPNHHVKVLINGQPVVEDRWDGQGWHTLESEIPSDVLKEGKNR